ncbi:MAG: efflux transporter outer membrane subunit [Spirochaetales bacterium]|jgi:multidrug efflux system outer membrane protein|nr:efflux transporter outer membrane subunit [Spirochaetales bacterium]
MRKKIIKSRGIGVVLVMVASCSVGPDYKRPDSMDQATPVWEDAKQEQLDPAKVVQFDWWQTFNDPKLKELIVEAVSDSFDLKILFGRIRAAGAMVDSKQSDLFPKADATSSATFSQKDGEGDSQFIESGVGITLELDFWGKARKGVKASKAEHKALEAEYRAGYLKLVSDVAVCYFTILQYDRQLVTSNNFLANHQIILAIYEAQYKAGIVGKDKVLREKASLAEIKQDGLEITRSRKIQEHKIATLLGKPTGLIRVDQSHAATRATLVDVPVGLPSDLLQRRPDLVAYEYRLLRATQEIGIAEAARFPSISLTAKGGLASAALNSLLSGGVISIMPQLNLPLFDGGSRKAEVKRKVAEADVAKYKYAKAINVAFQEVSDSLTNIASRKEQRTVLAERVLNLEEVQGQIQRKLELGLISQLEILDVELNLYTAKKDLDKLDTNLLSDTIALYKALGGGWPKEIIAENMKN